MAAAAVGLLLAASPARADLDGQLTRAEAEELLRTPLHRTITARQAEDVPQTGVLNGLMLHCRMRWQPMFEAMTALHRERLGRPQRELNRIATWHGFWQARRFRPHGSTCRAATTIYGGA